ncbi:copper transport protein ATX1 [Solanum lycopersicum]|uniref:HMA domain-containing protein n=1 Tax=Solanum lycopersicum TaxID=4081 RepID=A0A3Q7IQV1_SOLLC|nr:copper transport protein ATX1 isoform X2 [Solanum lycopersicum]
MSQTVVLKVGMSCQGCVGAVNRVLGKMEGVESFDIDIKEQKVTVIGNVEPEAVFQTVSKTGKKTSYWEEPAPASAPEPETKPVEEKPVEEKPTETPAEPEPKPTEEKPAETVA